MSMHAYYMLAENHESQKGAEDPLELEVQVVVNHHEGTQN